MRVIGLGTRQSAVVIPTKEESGLAALHSSFVGTFGKSKIASCYLSLALWPVPSPV